MLWAATRLGAAREYGKRGHCFAPVAGVVSRRDPLWDLDPPTAAATSDPAHGGSHEGITRCARSAEFNGTNGFMITIHIADHNLPASNGKGE